MKNRALRLNAELSGRGAWKRVRAAARYLLRCQRIYTPWFTFIAFLGQVLTRGSACREAVRWVQACVGDLGATFSRPSRRSGARRTG